MKKFIGQACAAVVVLTLCATVIPSVAAKADTTDASDTMLISTQDDLLISTQDELISTLTKDNFEVDDVTLYQIDGSTKTAVADLSDLIQSTESDKDDMRVSAVYGKNVYMTHFSADTWNYKTYVYNTETKAVTLASENMAIMDTKGEYAVCKDVHITDVSAFGHYLYKLTDDGMVKVRTLAKASLGYKFIGNSIYFAAYPFKAGSADYKYTDMGKVVVKKIDLNKMSVKKLATIKAKKNGMVIVTKFGKKSCKVNLGGKEKTVKY